MISYFEWMLAFRFLRARRKEGFISVIAGFSFISIALGVATLIVVMAVMNGFRGELTKRILGINAHVSVFSVTGEIEDYDTLKSKLEQIPEVKAATPLVYGQVLTTANGEHAGTMIYGMRPQEIQEHAH